MPGRICGVFTDKILVVIADGISCKVYKKSLIKFLKESLVIFLKKHLLFRYRLPTPLIFFYQKSCLLINIPFFISFFQACFQIIIVHKNRKIRMDNGQNQSKEI